MSQIKRKVKEILTELKFKKPPISIQEVADHYNIKIRYGVFDDSLSGLLYREKEQPIIGVNALHSSVRQRFTIAHELGHHMLNHEGELFLDRSVLFRSVQSKDLNLENEKFANLFAAELLMPEDMVRAELTRGNYDAEDFDGIVNLLAKKFDVSTQAMAIRLQKLDIMNFLF